MYTFLETVLDALALLPYFIEFFQEESRRSSSAGYIAILFLAFGKYFFLEASAYPKDVQVTYHLVFVAVLNLAFALSLLCFISMHMSLVLSNTTSVEVTLNMNTLT